jgi:hypothetical protein
MSLYKSCGILPFGWSKTPANDADIEAHCTVNGSTFCNIDTTIFKDGKCVAKIPGCTNPDSPNFNNLANIDDESCYQLVQKGFCTGDNLSENQSLSLSECLQECDKESGCVRFHQGLKNGQLKCRLYGEGQCTILEEDQNDYDTYIYEKSS